MLAARGRFVLFAPPCRRDLGPGLFFPSGGKQPADRASTAGVVRVRPHGCRGCAAGRSRLRTGIALVVPYERVGGATPSAANHRVPADPGLFANNGAGLDANQHPDPGVRPDRGAWDRRWRSRGQAHWGIPEGLDRGRPPPGEPDGGRFLRPSVRLMGLMLCYSAAGVV